MTKTIIETKKEGNITTEKSICEMNGKKYNVTFIHNEPSEKGLRALAEALLLLK